MDYVDESDVVMFAVKLTHVPERKQISPSNLHQEEKSVFRTCCFAERQLYMTLELGLKLGRTF